MLEKKGPPKGRIPLAMADPFSVKIVRLCRVIDELCWSQGLSLQRSSVLVLYALQQVFVLWLNGNVMFTSVDPKSNSSSTRNNNDGIVLISRVALQNDFSESEPNKGIHSLIYVISFIHSRIYSGKEPSSSCRMNCTVILWGALVVRLFDCQST